MRVFVYYNLHKKVFSVRALAGEHRGRVVAHCTSIVLDDVEFRVSEAGRSRVLRTKQKNVHAGVAGTWRVDASWDDTYTEDLVAITYNPYIYTSFVLKDSESPVFNSKMAVLKDRKIFAKI